MIADPHLVQTEIDRRLEEILGGSDFGLLLLDDSPDDLRQLGRRMAAAGFTPPDVPEG